MEETRLMDVYDRLVLGQSFAATAPTVDDFKADFNTYGVLSVVFTTSFPLLWKYILSDSATYNTTGYKIAAYSHLFTWSPLALTYTFFSIFGTGYSLDWVDSAMRFSVAGPWLIQIFAIYVLFATGIENTSAPEFVGVFTFIAYNIAQMAMQYVLIPGVSAYTTGYEP